MAQEPALSSVVLLRVGCGGHCSLLELWDSSPIWTTVCLLTLSCEPPPQRSRWAGERGGRERESASLSPSTDSHLGHADSFLMAASPSPGLEPEESDSTSVHHQRTPEYTLHHKSTKEIATSSAGMASPGHLGQRMGVILLTSFPDCRSKGRQ